MRAIVAVPRVVIEADGTPLADGEARALTGVRVQQRLSLPALCELTFADPPGPLTVDGTLTPGTPLRVRTGGHDEPLFDGEVTALEYVYEPARGRELRVRGYDRLHRLRKRQTVRAHVQVSAEDLARELTSDLGVTVDAAESGPVWPHLIQHQQSDLELLTEVAARCGLFLALRGDTLHLLTLDGTGESVPLTLGESLLEARVEVNGDPACREVAATGWDALRVEVHSGNAANARVGRNVDAEVDPSDVGGGGTRDLVDEEAQDDDHAGGLAQAELDRRIAREVTLWGIAEGDPRLRPGTPVELDGLAESIAGRYVLTAVTHTLDEQRGFLSEIDTTPPSPRPRERYAVATVGVVTRVDDPQDKGRVRVKLPTYGDVETEWMGVLTGGAGKGKGLVAIPDVDDYVLVLLAHGDPGQGVVLGGLYGMEGPPDSGVVGGAVRRYTLVTPEGQRLRLDDEKTTVRLETSGGSYIELAPGGVRLHAAADLTLEAPGHAIAIRGRQIDFTRA